MTRKTATIGLSLAMPIVAIFTFGLRVQARRIQKQRLGADDWTLFVALIFAIAFSADIIYYCVDGNLGGHEAYTPDGYPKIDAEYTALAIASWVASYIFYICAGFTKISALFLYRRTFVTHKRQTFSHITNASILFCCLWTITFFLGNFLSCLPISALWNTTNRAAKCINSFQLQTVGSTLDIVTDIFILSLPVFEIAKLHMPLRRKAGVAGIFLLGMLVVIAGVIRTVMLVQAEHAITNERYNDISYNYAPIYYWTVIETSVGVISACLPTLWPVFAKVSNRIRKVSDSARSTIPRSYPHSKLSEDATVWPKENSSQKGLCNSPNAIDNGPLERGDETSIDGISSKGPHGIELKMLGSHGYPSSQQDKTIIV